MLEIFFSKKSECIMQLSHSVTKFMKKPRKMAVVKYVVVEVALRLEVGTYIRYLFFLHKYFFVWLQTF